MTGAANDNELARSLLRANEMQAALQARRDAGDPLVFSAAHWLQRDIQPLDYLLGDAFSTTTRAMLVGSTGIGKSQISMGIAFAMSIGSGFLHWKQQRPAKRILYIDGEMSVRVARDRIAGAAKRHGAAPDNLHLINRDDFPHMPPLNSEVGQRFIDALIEKAGGVEFIIFDNIQSLLVGQMKEEDAWSETLPWVRSLTRRSIGQLWVHHTGHDATRSYGTKTREWQLDTVMLMTDRINKGELLVDFDLSFTKARERNHLNRADFGNCRIWINADGQWESSVAPASQAPRRSRPLTPETLKALEYLTDVLAQHGTRLERPDLPRSLLAVKVTLWRDRLRQRGLCEKGAKGRQVYCRIKKNLITANMIVIDHDLVWKVAR